MTSWKRWALLGLLTLALALGLLRALDKRQQQQDAAGRLAASSQAPSATVLSAQDLFRAEAVELRRSLPFTGTLKAVHSATLKARVAGELRGLSVREGDRVRAGQLLAQVDATEARARLAQAEQQVQANRAQLAITQRQQDNNQALVRQGFISSTAAQTSELNLETARANLQASQAQLDIARKALADTELRAPISGQVAARLVQDGERVPVDARVLEIIDTRALEIEAALPPADALQLRVGQPADWSVEGVSQPSRARVARINPAVQTGSRSLLTYLTVPAQDGLRQGLFVQGRIETGQVRAVAVPLSALRSDQPQPYLQLLQDGQVVHRQVVPGQQGQVGGETLVAIDGLAPGTLVLRASAGALAAGTPARAVPSAAQPDAAATR
ncbi:efflux RND transporter periplasmic adaptor subunit [Malikia spinosa]|uniref:efflux RND transporter periplasmic adaptor subunit n=1 Tax=Malikia spinosa TaxID=86180 RepID=UPI003FA20022